MSYREHLKRYGDELKERRQHLESQATDESIALALDAYQTAEQKLQEFMQTYPEAWEEYTDLWQLCMHAEKAEKHEYKKRIDKSPAHLYDSRYDEKKAQYMGLKNARESRKAK